MNTGVPFWPTWHSLGKDHNPHARPKSWHHIFDLFFRLHANKQPPDLIVEKDVEERSGIGSSEDNPIVLD
jgi:hypothetical protein